MKRGECKYGERCKFHHPVDRLNAMTKQASCRVKLSLAGVPEGGEVMAKTISEADAVGGTDMTQ
ncbi:unnamed protein product [Brassica napus]|uniref:(rape) hypothetical protein n=1 Tax=Brassica napus TaxID=3708 RepID=A0A816S087_BRANA|nr:unnamed protein product [Brassica napus]